MMTSQVLTISQMTELGIDSSETSMIWEHRGSKGGEDFYNLEVFDYEKEYLSEKDVPTFTLQDLLKILPREIKLPGKIVCRPDLGLDYAGYVDEGSRYTLKYFNGETLLQAVYELIKWLKENGYISSKRTKNDEYNKRK